MQAEGGGSDALAAVFGLFAGDALALGAATTRWACARGVDCLVEPGTRFPALASLTCALRGDVISAFNAAECIRTFPAAIPLNEVAFATVLPPQFAFS